MIRAFDPRCEETISEAEETWLLDADKGSPFIFPIHFSYPLLLCVPHSKQQTVMLSCTHVREEILGIDSGSIGVEVIVSQGRESQ